MSFDGLLGLDTVSVRDIRSIGTGGALALNQSGAGQIPEDGSVNSGRAIQGELLPDLGWGTRAPYHRPAV